MCLADWMKHIHHGEPHYLHKVAGDTLDFNVSDDKSRGCLFVGAVQDKVETDLNLFCGDKFFNQRPLKQNIRGSLAYR